MTRIQEISAPDRIDGEVDRSSVAGFDSLQGRHTNRIPLASESTPYSGALERRCDSSGMPEQQKFRSPPDCCSGSSVEFFRCMTWACSWVGSDVLARVLDSDYIHDLMCPRCKGGVMRAVSCCDCMAAPAELGDERCGPCVTKLEQEDHEARMLAAHERASREMVNAFVSILTGVSHG